MSQKRIFLYAHGSAYNHGCEAIVRSTCELLSLDKEKTTLFSNRIEGDLEFHLDDIIKVLPIAETPVEHNSFLGYVYRLRSHLHSDHEHMYYRYFGKRQYRYMYHSGEVAVSIGGDNYCYPSAISGLEVRNYWLNKKGIKTILWGASISDEFLTDYIVEDMNRYSLIVVRETLSYELLKEKHVKTKILCAPDPAFSLIPQDTPWPDEKEHDNVIGINISPFVTECSSSAAMGINNYVKLIDWILGNTDCEIALIPHVVFPNNGSNDIDIIKMLQEHLPKSKRIFTVPGDYNCCQLKSLISKCRFFVGARTHATIAAYSSCVPTLVVGYSVKSIGIARDIFGTEEGYVCSVQNLADESILREMFISLFNRETEIRQYLSERIPNYLQGYTPCIEAVKQLIEAR